MSRFGFDGFTVLDKIAITKIKANQKWSFLERVWTRF